jgi:hypothetical protein
MNVASIDDATGRSPRCALELNRFANFKRACTWRHFQERNRDSATVTVADAVRPSTVQLMTALPAR